MDRKPAFRRPSESSHPEDRKDTQADNVSLREAQLLTFARHQYPPNVSIADRVSLSGRAAPQPNIAPTVPPELVAQMDRIITSLPAEETKEYYHALAHVPELVQVESDPAKFLLCCDLDSQSAAKRLVAYWKRRSKIFGPRAYFPMTCASNGALTNREVEYLQSTHLVLLSNDSAGRSVFCDDGARRVDHDHLVRWRIAFYLAQIISENPLSQSEGFVGITVIQTTPKYDKYSAEAGRILCHTMPARVKSWHVVNLTSDRNLSALFDKTFRDILSFPSTIHQYKHKGEILSALGLFGLLPEGLPRILGGGWCYNEFLRWQLGRRTMESQQQRVASIASVATAASNQAQGESGGPSNDWVPGQSGQNNVLKQAMLQVPGSEKQAYLEAIAKAPADYWEKECNLDWFLQTEDFNCNHAAQRVARYCQLRSDSFGSKRFSPLNQSSEDALGRADLNVINTIFLLALPEDSSGRPVLWIDGSRLPSRLNPGTVDRCLFYFFSLLAENDKARLDGAVLLYNFGNTLQIHNHLRIDYLRRLSSCLPLRVKAIHLIYSSGASIPVQHVSSFEFAENVYKHDSFTDPWVVVSKLQRHGLDPRNLPKSLGGDWGTELFCQWQEMRTRCEWNLPLGLSGRSATSGLAEFPAIRPYTVLSEDREKSEERRRRLNVIHTRRKRDRVRIEIEVLNEQIAEQQAAKARNTQENQRLTALLQSAREIERRIQI